MRLTCILFRKNLLPNGHLFKGKDRLVRKVLPVDLRHLKERFEIEEKNMFYLRHPYLTEEQSAGHAKALGKYQKRMERLIDNQTRIFKHDVTLAERLMHLRVSETWEK